MPRPDELLVPKGDGTSQPDKFLTFEVLTNLQSLVIVGANGSGKSRFGYAIEMANQQTRKVQRLAAQRALQVPEEIAPVGLDSAEELWYYGRAGSRADESMRILRRWNNKPVTGLLNDYEHLLKLVFAKSTERAHDFYISYDPDHPPRTKPSTVGIEIEEIWNQLLPHRQIRFESSKVLANVVNEYEGDASKEGALKSYNAAEMSDGERVMLYLLASALVAPKDSVLIIDEPEIHLHRAIRGALFNAIEAKRDDCLFVYLTHDVEFAAARPAATKLWLQQFTGSGWIWDRIKDDYGLPPALVTELLGSRRPVLFVEGEHDSLDTLIYSASYPDRYIVPAGSCGRVIQFTKALRGAQQLHHLDAVGIIDRDRRTDDDVEILKDAGVFVLDVAEVENLLLAPAVLNAVLEKIDLDRDKASEAEALVFTRLQEQRERQVGEHVHARIRATLAAIIDDVGKTRDELVASVKSLKTRLDVDEVWKDVESFFDEVITSKDYVGVLRLFNDKTLVRHVANTVLGLSPAGQEDGLSNLIRRHLRSHRDGPIVEALQQVLPNLNTPKPLENTRPQLAAS